MEPLTSILPVLAVLIPFFMSIPVYLIGKHSDDLRDYLAVATTVVVFLLTLLMIPPVLNGKMLEYVLLPATVSPIPLEFMADPLGLFVAIISAFAWMLATIYSVGYMAPEHAKNRYYSFMVLNLGAMLGVVLSRNLFTLYIFFEILAIASWVLVIHEETEDAMAAGKKYLFMGIGGGLFLLFGIIVTFIQSNTLDITKIGILTYQGPITHLVFYAYIIGFGVKAGMFPMHVWLPDAHPVAPSPCSALLSGVMIKAGAYGIIRTVYNIFGTSLIRSMNAHIVMAGLAGTGIILGSAVAISQKSLKRMLAYSSVSMICYVILGSMFLTQRGLEGAMLHLFAHLFMKDVLFLCAGAFIFMTGKKNIEDYKGIGRKMPFTMLAFTIAAMSMIGLPPFVGFISKWYLLLGSLDAGTGFLTFYVVVLLGSSLMNAVYYMPIIIGAYFGDSHGEHEKVETKEAPWVMVVPILIFALGVVFFGMFPNIPLKLIKPAAKMLLMG